MTPPRKSKIVCACLEITEAELLKSLQSCPMRTLNDVIRNTSAGEGCTACHPILRGYLERQRAKEARQASPSSLPPGSPKDSSAALSL